MANILILGAGKMGSVVAKELAKTPNMSVTVADQHIDDHLWDIDADISRTNLLENGNLAKLMEEADLTVCALPAALGKKVWQCALELGKGSVVDMSYQDLELGNYTSVDKEAKEAGITILTDCGVAPGLTNLVIGRVLSRQENIEMARLFVGGMAKEKSAPYGYSKTWSLNDLYEEYTRPARVIHRGKVTVRPALTGCEEIQIPGVGFLEGFLTDGLRSLLRLENVTNMVEKTLRWPGHIKAIQPLLEDGKEFFLEEIGERCKHVEDMLVMHCIIDQYQYNMVEYARDGMTAMQRTTALTCVQFAKLQAMKTLKPGLVTPEEVGQDEAMYKIIVEGLKESDVELKEIGPE